MKVSSTWLGGAKSELLDEQGHKVIIDLPEEKGGANSGATALDLCLMSLAGCINTIFIIMAGKMHLTFDKLQAELDITRDGNTVTGVLCTLNIHTGDDHSKIEKCVEKTIETCPVGGIFRNAGIALKHEINYL